ncbi:MAG: hypothetical protein COS89_04885 [Deltaproteobacteria bacterium CG07_land_8_20_14_0_80_38_7]|nr:MAG: hypothetical protein COS89_04885 [Deltaproteobacteria bacterium CG07_land_8_20_14_0_80_38_7]
MLLTKVLNIYFLGRDSLKKKILKPLSHVYPNMQFSEVQNFEGVKPDSDLIIIDSNELSEAKLEKITVLFKETPVLIVIPDAKRMREMGHFVSGRRDIITEQELNEASIARAAHYLIERQKLHEQLKKAAYRLKDVSIRDDLTRLYNYQYFNEILLQEVKKASRYRRPLSLVVADLKNFSKINSAIGDHEGDRLLAKTSETILSTIREVDIAARLGDNSFAVVLPETNMNAAVRVGDRLNDVLSAICRSGKETCNDIFVSIGISSLDGEIKTKEDLLRDALAALELSKKNGKLCTNEDLISAAYDIKEDRKLIEQMHLRIVKIGSEAEESAFHSTLKIINEMPVHKKCLIPHSERVAFYAERLVKKIEKINGMAHKISRAALVHDIGKLAIDNELLNKKEKLNNKERVLLEQHSTFGSQMLNNIPFLSNEYEIVLCHHERYDGCGYPQGLKGEEIPIGARIVSLTEAWDTMINPQPYREKALSLDEALLEINKGAGTQFDPELVQLFASLITNTCAN